MQHPLEYVPQGRRLPTFLALVGMSLVLHRSMRAPVETAAAPHGMLSFVTAGSVPRDRQILASWGPSARAQASHNLELDPVFSLGWTGATAMACLWATRPLATVRPAAATVGIALAWAQCLAAVLSTAKDAVLLTVLRDSRRQPWPQVAEAAALLEVLLKSAGIAYAAGGAIVWVRNRDAMSGD